MATIIETKKLSRAFGSFTALDKLDLNISEGEIFALLGPNGAGKSTAIKMLTTLLPPTSGEAIVGGFNLETQADKIRRIIGYVPQILSVDGTLTGYENLLLFAKLYDLPHREVKKRVDEIIDLLDLRESANHPVKSYSGGMVRRLEIGQSMLHKPKILFLDEPTVGLDPIGVRLVWEHILELKKMYDTTIFLTTHIMEEAENLCSRVAFLSRGKLAAIGTPDELKRSVGKEDATLEDVFIYYTAESLENNENLREVSLERKTSKRLG